MPLIQTYLYLTENSESVIEGDDNNATIGCQNSPVEYVSGSPRKTFAVNENLQFKPDLYTVKFGYNEHSVITNKIFNPKWKYYYINQPGYNEPQCYNKQIGFFQETKHLCKVLIFFWGAERIFWSSVSSFCPNCNSCKAALWRCNDVSLFSFSIQNATNIPIPLFWKRCEMVIMNTMVKTEQSCC